MDEKNLLIRLATGILTIIEKIFIFFGFVLVRNTPYLGRKRQIDVSFRAWDYNRYSSLDLCAYEIQKNKVNGNVAELGVYQGVFAAKLNEAFPDKKLYLFDTFEGFLDKDKKVEQTQSEDTKGININFSQTSVEYVLNKMKYKENCIVKQGYFPDSASNIDDTFCFVSIDADLYNPIYEGLRFFYSRLSHGGYIFVHDFNNKVFAGARKAVMTFCEENKVAYFPLSDVGGTVVISK
jgi:O-methyltransferase